MGNRGLNLHRGLRRLRELGLQILRHSALYETAAAYVTSQPAFLNAALLARTRLPPRDLLALLKQVEAEAGRDLAGGQRFGPRPLDLDIVFLGAAPFRDERLEVPHPRWRERPFVQAPVSDLLYRRDIAPAGAAAAAAEPSCSGHSGTGERRDSGAGDRDREREPLPLGHPGSVVGHLQEVRQAWLAAAAGQIHSGGGGSSGGGGVSGGEVMRRVTPLINLSPPPPPSELGSSGGSTSTGAAGGAAAAGDGGGRSNGSADSLLSWAGRRTHLMAILNVTPDSFSDGGAYDGSVAAAVAAAERAVAEGADLVDVGGQSTRPGAVRLSPQEELARVMPVLRALRQSPALRSVPISIDTFHAEVARQAVRALPGGGAGVPEGANIVNDVTGGEEDPAMRATVAELGVPYVVMHMRGDPGSMSSPKHTTYGSVWREVGSELQRRAEAAEAAGVPAWNIILDPGIGFAKTAEGNLELLRELLRLRREALDGPYAAPPPPPPPPQAADTDAATGSAGACVAGGSGSVSIAHGAAFGGAPMLVGPSRKRFLGSITGRDVPAERDDATAAACVVAVGAGAEVVRVHAVRPVRDALAVADAVYRGWRG